MNKLQFISLWCLMIAVYHGLHFHLGDEARQGWDIVVFTMAAVVSVICGVIAVTHKPAGEPVEFPPELPDPLYDDGIAHGKPRAQDVARGLKAHLEKMAAPASIDVPGSGGDLGRVPNNVEEAEARLEALVKAPLGVPDDLTGKPEPSPPTFDEAAKALSQELKLPTCEPHGVCEYCGGHPRPAHTRTRHYVGPNCHGCKDHPGFACPGGEAYTQNPAGNFDAIETRCMKCREVVEPSPPTLSQEPKQPTCDPHGVCPGCKGEYSVSKGEWCLECKDHPYFACPGGRTYKKFVRDSVDDGDGREVTICCECGAKV